MIEGGYDANPGKFRRGEESRLLEKNYHPRFSINRVMLCQGVVPDHRADPASSKRSAKQNPVVHSAERT